jgi:hypothetical protein
MSRDMACAIGVMALILAGTASGQSPDTPPLAARGAHLDTSGFRYQRSLPPGDPGLVVVALDAAALAHSQGPLRSFADVRVVDESDAQIPYVLERRADRLTLDLELRSAAPQARELRDGQVRNRSFYAITLPFENLPGPVIALQTSSALFRRPVELGVERAPDRRRREVTFERLAQAVWQHDDAKIPAPPLELALPSGRSRELLLIVDEGDNRPLPLAGVKLLLPGWQLRFLRPSGSLRLVYGRDDLTEPHFDIAMLAPSAMSGAARELTAEPERPAAAPAPIVSPRAFWAGLAVAVLLLLGVLVRLISSGSSAGTAPPSPPGP